MENKAGSWILSQLVDWRKVMTIVLTGALVLSWGWISETWDTFARLPSQVATNTATLVVLTARAEQRDKTLGRIAEAILTVTGIAKIQSDGTDMDSYLLINEYSDAGVHLDEDQLRVTNLSDPSRAQISVKVQGNFTSDEPGVVVILSRPAARLLRAGTRNEIRVRLQLIQ